jgi:hypothetical protein
LLLSALKLTIIIASILGALTWVAFYDDSTAVSAGQAVAETNGENSAGTAYEVDSSGRPHALAGETENHRSAEADESRPPQVDYAERAAAAIKGESSNASD